MKQTIVLSGLLLLLFFVFAIVNPGEGEKKMDNQKAIYQIMWNADNVEGEVYINDFAVSSLKGEMGSGSASLNPWLIGENEVRVELRKADPAQPAKFTFGVSEVPFGAMVATTDRGNLFSIDLKDSDFDKAGTARSSRKFKSKLDFSPHLSGAGEIKESEAVAYAKKLYALFERRDTDAILREFAVKIEDYGIVFGQPNFKAAFKSYLTGDLFKSKLVKINPAKLRAVSTGPGKKIWHILEGQEEMIRATSKDGSTSELAIFIGSIKGKLSVIR